MILKAAWATLWRSAILAAVSAGTFAAVGRAQSDALLQQRLQPSGAAVRRSISDYETPDITLVREDGRKVNMRSFLDEPGPVLVGFIFTTCAAICPLTSATFRQFQDRLGAAEAVRIASISIDPEQDTPARLRNYARKFGAGSNWHYYTGSETGSVAMQRAFGVDRGDKMDHTAVAFLRAAPGSPWVRFDGFVSAAGLLAEYRAMIASTALASR